MLAKQAGFDFQFQKAGQELKDAPLYLLPSVKGVDPMFKNDWFALLEKVKAGATLYMSLDDAYLNTFNEPLGIELLTNSKRKGSVKFGSKLWNDSLVFTTSADRKLTINPKATKVLAREPDGNPVFIESQYGKGKIFLLTFPIEANLTNTTGAFDKGQPAYAGIYRYIAQPFINQRVLQQFNPYIGVTEHPISDKEKIVVLINYSAEDITTNATVKSGWKITGSLYGNQPAGNAIQLKANDALVLTMKTN